MKSLALLTYLLFFIQIGFTQQYFDKLVSVVVDGEPQFTEQEGTKVYNFLQDDGTLVSLTQETKPLGVSKICSNSDLAQCYTGIEKGINSKAKVNSKSFVKVDGYKALLLDYTIDIPGRGNNNAQLMSIYFNKTIYTINIIYNPYDEPESKLLGEKVMKSIHINDHNKQYSQLESCTTDESIANESTSFKIGYFIGKILIYLGIPILLLFVYRKKLF